jgi:hypothetical protein
MKFFKGLNDETKAKSQLARCFSTRVFGLKTRVI